MTAPPIVMHLSQLHEQGALSAHHDRPRPLYLVVPSQQIRIVRLPETDGLDAEIGSRADQLALTQAIAEPLEQMTYTVGHCAQIRYAAVIRQVDLDRWSEMAKSFNWQLVRVLPEFALLSVSEGRTSFTRWTDHCIARADSVTGVSTSYETLQLMTQSGHLPALVEVDRPEPASVEENRVSGPYPYYAQIETERPVLFQPIMWAASQWQTVLWVCVACVLIGLYAGERRALHMASLQMIETANDSLEQMRLQSAVALRSVSAAQSSHDGASPLELLQLLNQVTLNCTNCKIRGFRVDQDALQASIELDDRVGFEQMLQTVLPDTVRWQMQATETELLQLALFHKSGVVDAN